MDGNWIKCIDWSLVNVEDRDELGYTALHQVAHSPYFSLTLTRVLLDHGANPNAPDNAGDTLAHLLTHEYCAPSTRADMAFGNKCLALLSLLQSRGMKLTLINADGNTPMHMAAACGNLDLLARLAQMGACWSQLNSRGQSASEIYYSMYG